MPETNQQTVWATSLVKCLAAHVNSRATVTDIYANTDTPRPYGLVCESEWMPTFGGRPRLAGCLKGIGIDAEYHYNGWACSQLSPADIFEINRLFHQKKDIDLVRAFFCTREGQQWRQGDFVFGVESEPCMIPLVDHPDHDVDDPCGCRRSFDCLYSCQGTTTARIGYASETHLFSMLTETMPGRVKGATPDMIRELAFDSLERITKTAINFDPFMIVERRGSVQLRFNTGRNK